MTERTDLDKLARKMLIKNGLIFLASATLTVFVNRSKRFDIPE